MIVEFRDALTNERITEVELEVLPASGEFVEIGEETRQVMFAPRLTIHGGVVVYVVKLK